MDIHVIFGRAFIRGSKNFKNPVQSSQLEGIHSIEVQFESLTDKSLTDKSILFGNVSKAEIKANTNVK